jgi:hypothetical protein
MPETMKLYSEYYMLEVKPNFNPYKTAQKYAQDYAAFSADFESKVNNILKDGWTLVNTNIATQGLGIMMTAILKKQS